MSAVRSLSAGVLLPAVVLAAMQHVLCGMYRPRDGRLHAWLAGPSTAAGMAAAKGWRSSLVPALLIGTFGYSCATFAAIALGYSVLRPMVPA